jgi:anti-sigma-K factor RskA
VNGQLERDCPRNEQAVGYALHALEPDEEMAVRQHLPQCASCRAVARDTEEVLGALAASVEQVDPPASLRDRIVARAAGTPQTTAARHQPPAPGPRPAAEPARRPRPARRRRLVAVAAALVAVVAIGGLAVRTTQLQAERDAQTARAQSVGVLLDRLDDPGVRHALLAGDGGATVAAVLVADGQRQVFTIGLPANAVDSSTYVLWGLADGVPQPLGTFDVAAADAGQRVVGSAPPSEAFAAYAVSIEPGRTAPVTPSTVVASGEVRA